MTAPDPFRLTGPDRPKHVIVVYENGDAHDVLASTFGDRVFALSRCAMAVADLVGSREAVGILRRLIEYAKASGL